MIKWLSKKVVEYWKQKEIVKEADTESYQYGMELVISTLTNFILMMLISVYMIRQPLAFIFYTIVYAPLRAMAGGYHADSHFKCVLYTQVTFIAFIFSIAYLAGQNIKLVIVSFAIAVLIILFMSPVAAKNKPLTQKEKSRQKHNTWKFEMMLIAILIFFGINPKIGNEIILYIVAANVSVAFSLLIAKIK